MGMDQSVASAGGPLLEAFDAIAAAGGDPRQIVGAQVAYIRKQILTNALPFFAELRQYRPILVTPAITVVSRFRDVEEILHRETVFSVAGYVPHMTGVIGPFILSLDLTPAYDHDKAAMTLAVRREDLGRVKQITAKAASDAVAAQAKAAAGKPFDIVQAVTRLTPVRLAADYFGFKGQSDAQVMAWARACFFEFFQNIDNNPDVRQAAVAAGAEMSKQAHQLIDDHRRHPGHGSDTVLSRLLAQHAEGKGLGFDNDGMVRTLMGLVIGMVETTSQAAVQALMVLAGDPPALAGAASAAAADDDDLLWAHIREALRYRPVNPLVIRALAADYRLAAGEARETLLPKGTVVFACTWSAMFDEAVLDNPMEFQSGRPAYHYLHFATGEHACFGRYISQVQITQILKPILKLKGLALAGPPVYAGPFPDKLEIVGT
jgi:cytochrome P450